MQQVTTLGQYPSGMDQYRWLTLSKKVRKIDYIYYLHSMSNVPQGISNPDGTEEKVTDD